MQLGLLQVRHEVGQFIVRADTKAYEDVSIMRTCNYVYLGLCTYSRMKEKSAAPKQKDVNPKIAVDMLKQMVYELLVALFHNFIIISTPCE